MNEEISLDHPDLKNRVVILNGFSNDEILLILKTVKGLCRPGPQGEAPLMNLDPGDLIFAKTTANSLNSVLKDTIVDMSQDHKYLKENPPKRP